MKDHKKDPKHFEKKLAQRKASKGLPQKMERNHGKIHAT
jgi:hypothetical protein